VNDQVDAFLAFLAAERRLTPNTLAAYRNDLRQFATYLGRARPAPVGTDSSEADAPGQRASVSSAEVAGFFLQLRERGYAPATIARKMAAVKALFQYLLRTGKISTNPAAALGAPEVKKPLPKAISLSEVDALIAQAGKRSVPEGRRDVAMLSLLCATGMRVSELVMLDLQHLELETATVQCQGRSGRMRQLPLPSGVVAVLRTYLEESRPQVLRAGSPTDALFLNHRGRRLTRQGFWLIMKTLARESGVTAEITPHTLRHSFAAHRLRDGLALSRLRDLLGHANISTTQIYTQVQLESDSVVTPVKHRDPVGATS
jgi:integrase/recombinase XerD